MTFNAGIEAAALKPCPFCGGRLFRREYLVIEGLIGCRTCGATIVRKHQPECDDGLSRAEEAWNTRPSSSAPVEQREAVAQALLDRFNQRSKRRTIGGAQPFPDGTKVSSLPASYRDDFYADADAVILSLPGSSRDEVLEQIVAVCDDHAADNCGHQLALRFVRNVAASALKSGGAK